MTLTVIHTPGHTPGGICLYGAPNLFSGDTLFAGGVARTDFPGGSTQELLEVVVAARAARREAGGIS